MRAAHCHRDALHAYAHPPHGVIMQNCAIDDVMMAHVARKEHTMAPYATAATRADPMGPTAATRTHTAAQGACHNVRWAGDSTGRQRWLLFTATCISIYENKRY